jgi:hypothetical protein
MTLSLFRHHWGTRMALVIGSCWLGAAQAQLLPEADAFVRGGKSYLNKNYGSAKELVVRDASGEDYDRLSYLRFNLSSLNAASSSKATLRLYVGSVASSPITLKLFQVGSDSWSESGITYSNRPMVGPLISSLRVSAPGYITFDVTNYISAELAGDKRASFVILDDANTKVTVSMHSKEGTYKPSLLVEAATPSDTIPPQVSLSAPSAGATVSGQVLIAADASDNVGVKSVQFQINGQNLGAADTTSPFSVNLDSKLYANGTHSIRAIAVDAAGNSTISAVRSININNDLIAPTVGLTSPAAGSTVSGSSVLVSADASDNVGIRSVQFQINGQNLGAADTSAPYSMTFDSKLFADGPHSLRAIAVDTSGNSSISAVRTINISNAAPPAPTPNPSVSGIWISKADIMLLPISGTAWTAVLKSAERDPGVANIADQDSNHDIYTLAAAFVCVRIGKYCDKARKGVVDAIGTEYNQQPSGNGPAAWLEVGRNLAAYVIAADLLDLRADGNSQSDGTIVENWIRGWPAKLLPNNITGKPHPFTPFESGSNASAQEGFAYLTVAAYLKDKALLDHGWNAFRRFVCDPGATDPLNIDLNKGVAYGWAHNDKQPCAVNPLGSLKQVPAGLPGAGLKVSIDGVVINDMRRGGEFQHPPLFTQYPWTGLAGLVPAAVVLQKAGYPAMQAADRAVLRTHEYLFKLSKDTGDVNWFNGNRGKEVVQLVNHFYGTSFPVVTPVSAAKCVAFTDWTHPKK